MFDVEHLKKTYFKMAIPVVIGLVITLVYNIVDTLFIAMTNDEFIIAGVSYCGPLFTLLMAFGNIFGQGGSSLESRLLGKNETNGIKKLTSFCFYGALFTSLLITALMLIFRSQFLSLLGANPTDPSYQHASDYYTWLAIGASGIICSFIHGNLLRCEGYANQAMIGHLIGTVVNIVLDPVLILGCKMGAKGAAIATILGYYISTIYFIIVSLKKSKFISFSLKDMFCEKSYILSTFGIGLTVAITNIMQSVSNTVLNIYLNDYIVEGAPSPIAAMGVVLKISLISQLVLSGFSFGAIPVFGYLFGSNNKEKIKELTKFNIFLLGGIALFITIILGCFAEPVCSIFFSKSKETVAMAATMLRWITISNIFMTMILIMTVLFQAGGKTVPALIMSISRQGVVFIIVLIIAHKIAGYRGVIATQAFSDVISFVIGIFATVICFRKFIFNIEEPSKENNA